MKKLSIFPGKETRCFRVTVLKWNFSLFKKDSSKTKYFLGNNDSFGGQHTLNKTTNCGQIQMGIAL